ncbi:MAG: hypothetical protein M1838_004899 [Thelocarpon superellum]|nr:MAG: hypothetical protein M1838_004899 [Thelocarpon superellum]
MDRDTTRNAAGMFSRSPKGKGNDLCAIFVHAGAGYHSRENEMNHLQACSDAALLAMRMLRTGCSAVDAVEIAIKVLEDRRITNAGYGSNLCMDGVVECDATVVDEHGRSGAVGAVCQIRNPISLARIILVNSRKAMTLRRVPPNLLVGDGARDYAELHHMPILPHDALITPSARERWINWKQELRRVEAATIEDSAGAGIFTDIVPEVLIDYEERARQTSRANHVRDMHNAIPLNPVYSPDLPPAVPPGLAIPPLSMFTVDVVHTAEAAGGSVGLDTAAGQRAPGAVPAVRARPRYPPYVARPYIIEADGSGPQEPEVASYDGASDSPPSHDTKTDKRRQDDITDTVGAIAVDCQGRIAAGSSSGGIGMKHRGRVGPAALVGIGTVVIPEDPNDRRKTTVAAVCSGTGEHMATTMAAGTFADRLYHSARKTAGGKIENVNDSEVLEGVILKDFMDHPSVRQSPSTAAIGILAAKKTKDGIYVYFAHNTDSFAVASMHSDDKLPAATMSRNSGGGSVAQGARGFRYNKRKL